MTGPANLTQTAIDDFDDILGGSLDYGADVAERLYDRLVGVFDAIGRGEGRGHRRTDLGFSPNLCLIHAKPFPFMVIYDQTTRIVLRVVHARRDFDALRIVDFTLPRTQ